MRTSTLASLTSSWTLAFAAAVPAKRSTSNPYAPFATSCPSGSLVRAADSLSPDEAAYVEARRPKVTQALSQWLSTAWGDSFTDDADLPNLALALSGGGPKAGLITAGVLYGLDGRDDSGSSVSGLLQSMDYVSALSGGSLTLAGVMSNDFAKISTLKAELYDKNYQNAFLQAINYRDNIIVDVGNKSAAGYPASLVDVYGRTISYNYIAPGPAGGDGLLWSNVTLQPSFQDFDSPYPIITITQANVAGDMCIPSDNSAIWEVGPLEFGSWDSLVGAFYPTKYMGTSGGNTSGQCTAGFDNSGYISGISSNILVNETANCVIGNYTSGGLNSLSSLINSTFSGDFESNPYGIIPNPFYQSETAGIIRDQENLYGVDGGYSGQGIPIFPWLQPERKIDVIFAVDSSSATADNVTDGGSIYETYQSAQMKGLTNMPIVPTADQFVAQDFVKNAHFYGCYNTSLTTVIYFPDTNLSAVTGSQFFYTPVQINSTIQGGQNMVTQFDDEQWPACLACGIMHKTNVTLPDSCGACLDKYCWNATESGGATPSPTGSTTGSGTPGPTASNPPYHGAASMLSSSIVLTLLGTIAALAL